MSSELLSAISIIAHMRDCIANGDKDERFIIPDDEHVIDTATGVTYHIHDHWYKLTYGEDDRTVATQDDFTDEVLDVIREVKELISPPGVLDKKREELRPLWEARMQLLSDLYENPTPMNSTLPVTELGTKKYKG